MSRLQPSYSQVHLGSGGNPPQYQSGLSLLLASGSGVGRGGAGSSPSKLRPLVQQQKQRKPRGLAKSNSAAALQNQQQPQGQKTPQRLAPLQGGDSSAQSSYGSSEFGQFVPGRAGETIEAHAFRSLPAHSSAAYSHYYTPAESRPQRVLHVHQYPDGSVVEECTCERGGLMVQQQQQEQQGRTPQYQPQPVRQEEKEAPQLLAAPTTLSPLKMLSPSQMARASSAPYAQQVIRPKDTSRLHSTYASQFPAHHLEKFTRQGRGYFAANNKSYIRRCMQDAGYGFQLGALEDQNSPQLLNFAAEISREHADPNAGLRAVIAPANWPNTTHLADFSAPSPELLLAYKRVGKDYRQAGNRSYIRCNLIDQEHSVGVVGDPAVGAVDARGARVVPPNQSSVSSVLVKVPFTAQTTHKESFLDFTPQYPTMRAQAKASVLFGMESRPSENIWQRWDDNCADNPEDDQQQ